jgi:hypothetical protein
MEAHLGDIELTLTPQEGGGAIWRFALEAQRLPSFARDPSGKKAVSFSPCGARTTGIWAGASPCTSPS